MPGSPYANITVAHLSVNKKYLFAADQNHNDVYTFSIASNGALKKISTTNVKKYSGNCGDDPFLESISIDATGSTLYTALVNCTEGATYQSFRIESNGDLQYLGSSKAVKGYSPLTLLGTNKYGYGVDCQNVTKGIPFDASYKRESSGLLTYLDSDAIPLPPPPDADDVYCPTIMASDASHHVAIAVEDISSEDGPGGFALATYTADSKGNLTTTSTAANMAQTSQNLSVSALSISPSGKLLAAGGRGFEIFHFNGGAPAAHFSGLLLPDYLAAEFGWDTENHLYALTDEYLAVYTVTPASITQAPGSPYLIPEASSLIVFRP